jgi:hypothetical protein
MTALANEKLIKIAKDVAKANNVSVAEIVTAPVIDSTGAEAIEIKIVLSPGSLDAILGEHSARTISQVIQHVADAGEARFPIVTYE